MSSVTQRIKEIKQPLGGYIKPSEFETIAYNDGILLNEEENISASIIGMAVDYLTRFMIGANIKDAFAISLLGAERAEFFRKGSKEIANNLLENIIGLDDESIISACKLVAFDIWFRNIIVAITSKTYKDINPDVATIENIRTLIKRSINFFEIYGPITKSGFTFEPENYDSNANNNSLSIKEKELGGYTAVVDSGDGDFLTVDTLWDYKVLKDKPTNKHTLQLIMYWIMGQHSGQSIFKNITKLGIFNPRLNTVYLLEISKVSSNIIETIEKEVICYK